MDKGMRNILVVLGIFALVSLVSAVKFFQIERATYRQYLEVKSKNAELSKKTSSFAQEKLMLAKKLERAGKELREMNKEGAELKKKHDLLLMEKKKLSMQVKKLAGEKAELGNKVSEVESDDFLARLLNDKVSLEVKVKKLEDKLKKTQDLEKKVEAISKANLELKELLVQEEEVSGYLSKDFFREKQERLVAINKVKNIEAEKDKLKAALDGAMKEKVPLEKKLTRLIEKLKISEDERKKLANRMTVMEKALKEKSAEINLVREKLKRTIKKSKSGTKEVVELPPIVVKAKTSSSQAQPKALPQKPVSQPVQARSQMPVKQKVNQRVKLEGKIMTINEKHRFVVIDLGEDTGLETGTVFGIYRGKKEIGKVKVVEIRGQISAADIVSLKSRVKIKPGDKVKSK